MMEIMKDEMDFFFNSPPGRNYPPILKKQTIYSVHKLTLLYYVYFYSTNVYKQTNIQMYISYISIFVLCCLIMIKLKAKILWEREMFFKQEFFRFFLILSKDEKEAKKKQEEIANFNFSFLTCYID